ncbi:DNA cytosine methyltransferase [Muribaculaceae bacterium Isolate-039 (Harlan)]|jgi:DNA-methyltransferase (dcm)|uniref:Cytosine-specific methyltransferase n=1 Tax=Muribaculum intestinale TaxID=1796646 RepID=A0A1B1S8W2_9BACT|nr:DNA cytosine methyltransferase [Muribaculum intestinale]ROS84719.1 DNA cytosine methyltransferase [Muribaculaceae bacterium Isolate-039 (Harlan)]ANU63223.1 DNA cytosine methyltransferase [Muribaculum intestinale]ASB38698.1 DNA cytosine methyltransferase [Muribaculum intestinale]PWB00871.1 DNA cytosine methyltransferase [Muribaculum intestinale]QQR09440.1 DNA cytosine methyltransferase [Muribaculum intestinale]
MINIPISSVKTKTDKEFFVEKVRLYIRLIECYVQKERLSLPQVQINNSVISEWRNIGFISTEADIKLLAKTVGKDAFAKLINCTAFALSDNDAQIVIQKIHNAARKKLQSKKSDKPTIVDLFCGAGGLSLGFIEAGYQVVLANDIQDVCCETYKYNHPELSSERVIMGDIRQVLDDFSIPEDVDIVVGGPPCQGFSSANQHHKVIDDPRNLLYKYFIEAVTKFAPKFVVMENVRGMLKVADQVISDYNNIRVNVKGEEVHYIADYQLLNSQNFGVAQSRERLIYIAIRSDIAEHFNITPASIYKTIESSMTDRFHALREALEFIRPLESPRIKGLTNVDDEATGKKIDINEYTGTDNEYLTEINCGRTIPFVFNHKARYASDTNYQIFERLEQGDDATDEKIKDIMPYSHRNHCFKDKYYKLIADKPCRTITAHLRMDCLSHIHPFQVRTITPREAARIQSFPDDYLFMGAYLKTYMQVGNAVPPLMAKQIATAIKPYLK